MANKKAEKPRATHRPIRAVVRRRSLAEVMAREFFKVGDEPGLPCTRIEFRASNGDGTESANGGLCEPSLANLLRRLIEAHLEVVE